MGICQIAIASKPDIPCFPAFHTSLPHLRKRHKHLWKGYHVGAQATSKNSDGNLAFLLETDSAAKHDGVMDAAVTKLHAHSNVVWHCLYAYYILKYSTKELARVFSKSGQTIRTWVREFERTGTFERTVGHKQTKFTREHRTWLAAFYTKYPLAYIDEAQAEFKTAFQMEISCSTVWRIVHELGFTRKMIERHAMHIKEKDVFRFVEELSAIDWNHWNLVFLDESSFDNRCMIHRRGYAPKGKKLAIRRDFLRKPRISILAFIGVTGILGFYDTKGTFDRVTFIECCRAFAYSESGSVRQYPGLSIHAQQGSNEITLMGAYAMTISSIR